MLFSILLRLYSQRHVSSAFKISVAQVEAQHPHQPHGCHVGYGECETAQRDRISSTENARSPRVVYDNEPTPIRLTPWDIRRGAAHFDRFSIRSGAFQFPFGAEEGKVSSLNDLVGFSLLDCKLFNCCFLSPSSVPVVAHPGERLMPFSLGSIWPGPALPTPKRSRRPES